MALEVNQEQIMLEISNTSTDLSQSQSQSSKTEPDEHRTHCDNCFNIKKCMKLKSLRKSRPEEFISCSIIYCRFNCSRLFHQCKKEEHELLCPNVKVPCINEEFGCPIWLERRLRGKHLATCPASVIACTMEWNRWPLPPGKCQPFAFDPSHLDVASTLRDQRTITEWKQTLPSTLRNTLRNYMNERHPVMPLGVSGVRVPNCILKQAVVEDESADFSESTESDHDESSDSPWGAKKSPPGLQESVCNKLKTIKIIRSDEEAGPSQRQFGVKIFEPSAAVDDEEFHSCSSSVDGEDKFELEKGKEETKENHVRGKGSKPIDLNLIVEVITRYQCKPDSIYTFMCAREFRRDEYANHFTQVHSGIHTQLNGWLFTRCPLANQGCSFSVERMFPNDENYRIVFNEVLDTFCLTRKIEERSKEMENYSPFSNLPFELLIHLTKYLDPLSLNAFSMTSTLLREVCECVIVDRGIVVLQWEKNPLRNSWDIVEKKWLFSTSFSPIQKWVFGDIGRMANHLKVCPCFDRHVAAAPFSYPVSTMQL